ncbi:DUF1844 domain-containing protein [candidate division GN15 bacterium]|nr:DUF1844 domain-containing protein [candidate division GN15 bacterium]
MTDEAAKYDEQFIQLVMSLHGAAMQQMGKVMSPITGKVERNLAMAKASIDMLDMLKRKSQGNLTEAEQSLLDRFLYEARMNYVEESAKKEPDEEAAPQDASAAESTEPDPDAGGSDDSAEPTGQKGSSD